MGILILALCWQHLVAYASLTLLQFVDKVKRLCLLLSPSLGSYRLFNLPFCFITVIREIFCRADKPDILISYNPKTVFLNRLSRYYLKMRENARFQRLVVNELSLSEL